MTVKILSVYEAAAPSGQMGRRFFVVVFLAATGESSLFFMFRKIPSNFWATAASNSMTFYGDDNNLVIEGDRE
ncbi:MULTISPECIES: hypothetical protein [unclassified Paenibacillus]|uniref:hypothetical protein n=1 Tax=unclassified Paenibacillus TaxID=185978 RepID=UPI003836B0D9